MPADKHFPHAFLVLFQFLDLPIARINGRLHADVNNARLGVETAPRSVKNAYSASPGQAAQTSQRWRNGLKHRSPARPGTDVPCERQPACPISREPIAPVASQSGYRACGRGTA